MKTKKYYLKFLKFFKLRNKKKKVNYKDSIRPMKTNTVFPNNWSPPLEYICKDGTRIPYGFTNFLTTKPKDRISCSDSIDNSY